MQTIALQESIGVCHLPEISNLDFSGVGYTRCGLGASLEIGDKLHGRDILSGRFPGADLFRLSNDGQDVILFKVRSQLLCTDGVSFAGKGEVELTVYYIDSDAVVLEELGTEVVEGPCVLQGCGDGTSEESFVCLVDFFWMPR